VFNVDLKRSRGVNKGKPLPKGKFTVSKRMHFYKFWLKTGLRFPDRLCHFHDYMGNLRELILTGERVGKRLSASTLQPLNLESESIKRLILPPSRHPTPTQQTPSVHPILPPKESAEAQQSSTIQPDQTAGASNHGNKVVRDTGTRDTVYPPNSISSKAQAQSVEEWLAEYSRTESPGIES